MKKTTRIVSLLLALVMLAGILPAVVPTVAEAADPTTPATYYNHLPSTAQDVKYLSDMTWEYSDNYHDSALTSWGSYKDYQWKSSSKIVLGGYYTNATYTAGTTFDKGLGVMPKSHVGYSETLDDISATIFDLSDNEYKQSYFYSAVGITNGSGKRYAYNDVTDTDSNGDGTNDTFVGGGVVFEVWASYDKNVEDYSKAEYVLLERSYTVQKTNVYQFHLDVTGVRYLKLVVYIPQGKINSMNCAWGGTCVYNNPGYSPKTHMIGQCDGTDTGAYVAFDNRTDTQNAYMFNAHASMFNTYNYMNLPNDAIKLASYGAGAGTVLVERYVPGVGVGASWVGGIDYQITGDATGTNGIPGMKDGIKFPANSSVYFKNNKYSVCTQNGGDVAEGYVVYDLSAIGKEVDTFYSIIGITDQNPKCNDYDAATGNYCGSRFEVWGDYGDGNGFKLLAASEVIMKSNTGEFFVDITGVQKLKLRHYLQDSRTAANGDYQWHGAFAYASVYNRENTAEVYKTNMSLENSLPMSFAVEQSKVADLTNPYAKITYGDNVEVVNFNEWKTETIENVDYYRFTYENIAAKEMTDTVSVTIYDGYMPVAQVYEDTVQAYCLRQLANAKADGDTALEKVLVDLLNYGAAAQTFFDHNTGAMANGVDLSGYTGSSTTPTYTNNLVTSGTGYYKTNVSLESNIHMKFAFTGLAKGMTAKVTFTHHNSTEATTVDAEIVTDGSYGIVTLDELVVADCRQDVTVTIYDGETEICSVTDSVASYLARKAASDDSAVFDALMTLCDSAYAYFHPTTV